IRGSTFGVRGSGLGTWQSAVRSREEGRRTSSSEFQVSSFESRNSSSGLPTRDLESHLRLQRLRRAAQQIGRVVGQLLAAVPLRDRAARNPKALPCNRDHFLPAHAVREVTVAIMQLIQFRRRQAVEPRAVQKPELHGREATCAGGEDNLSRYDVKHHGIAVDVKRQARLKSLGLPLQITRQALVPNPRHDTGLLNLLK